MLLCVGIELKSVVPLLIEITFVKQNLALHNAKGTRAANNLMIDLCKKRLKFCLLSQDTCQQ